VPEKGRKMVVRVCVFPALFGLDFGDNWIKVFYTLESHVSPGAVSKWIMDIGVSVSK